MSDLTFTVPGRAVGKGRPRISRRGGQPRLYTPPETVSYEGTVAMCAHQAMAGAPLIEGPVRLVLAIYCQIPQSWSKAKRASALEGTTYPTTKPDVDNVLKAIADALNGVVWVDDVQVVGVAMTKRYAEKPCVAVTVDRLDKPPIDARAWAAENFTEDM